MADTTTVDIETACGWLGRDIPDMMACRADEPVDPTVEQAVSTPFTTALFHTLRDGGVEQLDVPIDALDTAHGRVHALLDSGVAAFKESGLPEPDMDRYTRAIDVARSEGMDLDAALETVDAREPIGVSLDALNQEVGSDSASGISISNYIASRPLAQVGTYLLEKTFPDQRVGVFSEGQLAIGTGLKVAAELNYDTGTGELGIKALFGERFGLRGKGEVGVYKEPSTEIGDYAEISHVASADVSLEGKLMVFNGEAKLDGKFGAKLSTKGADVIADLDPKFSGSWGPLEYSDTGRTTLSVGGGLGASVGFDTAAHYNTSMGHSEAIPEFANDDFEAGL